MKRKLVSVLACMALTATMFAGCGSDTSTTGGTSAGSGSSGDVSDDSQAGDSGDSSSASGDVVTIGFAQVGHESD